MREGGASEADNILRRSGFDTAIGMGSTGDIGDDPDGDIGDDPGDDPGGDPGDDSGGADMVATIGSAGTSCVLGV